MSQMQVTRTIDTVGAEIRNLTAQAKCMTVYYGVEIGRRLVEAKSMLAHGQWGDWVRENTEFSQSTATRFMRCFEEYGADQIGIFGAEVNSSTLQNLSISNALRLLAVPKEEREEFAAAVDAENISARELEKAIRERDEARAKAAEQETYISGKQDAWDAAEKKAAALASELEELKNRPVEVAVQVDEQAVQRAAEQARAEEKQVWSGKLAALQDKLKAAPSAEALQAEKDKAAKAEEESRKAVQQAKQADARVEQVERVNRELEAKLKLADEDGVLFKAQFKAVQQQFKTLKNILLRIEQKDKERAQKLKTATAAVLDALKKSVEG